MQLWIKVTLGLILGILAGLYVPSEVVTKFYPLGTVFLNLIKMIIGLLIFFSLISAITSVGDPQILGRLGIKSVIVSVLATIVSVLLSIVMGNILKPGVGTILQLGEVVAENTLKTKFDILGFLINIFPSNPIDPFLHNNAMQVVFVSIFIGIVINKLENNGNIKYFFGEATRLIFKMISVIINLSPYAAFALISYVVSTQGTDILISLSKLIGAVVITLLIQYILFGLMILIFCRISPLPFYRKSLVYQLLAFSTSSSKAALPTTMEICKSSLGISNLSTSFVLPLCAAINMSGIAINLGITSIFFAQILGVSLGLEQYVILAFTAVIGSIGGAGVPSGSILMLPMVLFAIGLPIEGVAILAGIDRILDMMRTVINISGDVVVTLIVDSQEGLLDKKTYYS